MWNITEKVKLLPYVTLFLNTTTMCDAHTTSVMYFNRHICTVLFFLAKNVSIRVKSTGHITHRHGRLC